MANANSSSSSNPFTKDLINSTIDDLSCYSTHKVLELKALAKGAISTLDSANCYESADADAAALILTAIVNKCDELTDYLGDAIGGVRLMTDPETRQRLLG